MLAGVGNDLRAMDAALTSYGFDTTTLSEDAATCSGVRAAYRELIAATSAGDAAVVYYTGHGARYRNPGPGPAWLRYLVTTDRQLVSGGEFMGILAEEMSLLQAELTARTPNVTIILDCCYAARMSRGPSFLPKGMTALPGLPWSVIGARWDRLRSASRDITTDSNRSAVRVVACGSDQVAYELPPSFGGPRSALTSALVDVLGRAVDAPMSWHEVLAQVRPAVSDLVIGQRPEVEGPAARQLFGVEEKTRAGVLPVLIDPAGPYLPHPALFGVTAGDTYAVGSPPVATATVTAVIDSRARLHLDRDLPRGPGAWEAHPLTVSLGRRPIIVVPRWRADLFPAALRPAGAGELPLATVDLDAGTLLDAGGELVLPSPAPLAAITAQLASMARASHIRELPSGAGDEFLPDDVSVSFTLLPYGPLALRDAHMFSGDEVVIRLENRGTAPRFVSVFDIGLRGAVTLLSTSEPAGLSLPAGSVYELYRKPISNDLAGVRLYWPDGLPRGGPRPESFLVVATDRPQDLRALEQKDIPRRATSRSSLQSAIDALLVGRRRSPADSNGDPVRYRVQRFDFLLHPRQRPRPEPSFELDHRPDLSIRLSPPRPAGSPPSHVVLRLYPAHSSPASPVPRPASPRGALANPPADAAAAAASAVRTARVPSPWLHVLAATGATDGGIRHSQTTVAASGGGILFAGPVVGSVEVAIWQLPAPPNSRPVTPALPDPHPVSPAPPDPHPVSPAAPDPHLVIPAQTNASPASRSAASSRAAAEPAAPHRGDPAPAEGLVDVMAALVLQTADALPEATPLLRATLLPFDAPQTIATAGFVLELTVSAQSAVSARPDFR